MARFNRSHPGEGHYKAKLVLRWLALIITIIAIVFASLGRGFAWLLWIPLGLSFIWNIANIARHLSARTPIHPGANVGVDLVIWLAFIGTMVFVWPLSVSWFYWKVPTTVCNERDGEGNCVSFSGFVEDQVFDRELRIISILATTAAALSTVNLILHFTLFVIACVDTHRRRHADRYPEYRQDYEKVNELKDYTNHQTAYQPAAPLYEQPYGQTGI